VWSGNGLGEGPIPRLEVSYRVCVCGCVWVGGSECDKVPLHLKRVGRKRSTLRKKERKRRNLCEGYSKTCQKVLPQLKCR
jgi:hypothetical protein